jgi:hypothetical protein
MPKKILALSAVFAIALITGLGFYFLSNAGYDKCLAPNLKFDYYMGESVKSYYMSDSLGMTKFTKQSAQVVVGNKTCFDPNLYDKMISVLSSG